MSASVTIGTTLLESPFDEWGLGMYVMFVSGR
jgi:hypothetical protein